jgi:CspA family cold shock protein
VRYAEGHHLEIADAVARVLVQRSVDPNEVASALATLREQDNGRQFFRFLDMVVQEGQAVVRSGRTMDYYSHIRDVCREHLTPFQDEPRKMAYILGWAVRLMRYYRAEVQSTKDVAPSRRQAQSKRPATVPAGERQSGQVKFFRGDKGYGFIIPDGGGKDVFVHKSQLAGGLTALSSGQQVTYEVGQGRKGPEARDVRPA